MNTLRVISHRFQFIFSKSGYRVYTQVRNSKVIGVSTMATYQGNDEINYEKWTKRQLIKKLNELTNQLAELNGTPKPDPVLESKSTDSSAATRAPRHSTEQEPSGPPAKKAKKKLLVFTPDNTRFIALKFAYLGWNYQGLAVQKEETELPTVEGKILDALHMIKLIPTTDVNDCDFSRCGRTDKGVSAMNQVISLTVRSCLTLEERLDPENDKRELDYVNILNQVLPPDIRFHAICLRPPPEFDARFSCNARHYKYIFDSSNLDIELMSVLAKKFCGGHDFRNFCKIDGGKQITNFRRDIYSSQILPLNPDKPDSKYYVFDLRGKAFLWHQVRCMVAVLLMVGQGLEKPSVIDELLDISQFPEKPQYIMAHDVPLVLYNCEFDDEVKWTPLQVTQKTSRSNNNFHGQLFDYNLKSMIFDIMNDVAIKPFEVELEDRVALNFGDGKARYVGKNVPMRERDTMGCPEKINAKWLLKRKGRNGASVELEDGDE